MSPINFPLEKLTRSRWLIVIMLLLSIAVALASCGSGPAAETDRPQEKWQSQDIDNYRYTLTLSCFCPQELVQPVIVEVVNGEPASLTYAENGQEADPMFFENYSTIDKLHAIIAEAEAQDPARLDVSYDDTTGIPLNVDIDISELMADEEIRFTVTDFEQLP